MAGKQESGKKSSRGPKRPGSASEVDARGPGLVVRDVRALIGAIEGTDVTEIEVEVGGVRVHLKRGSPPAQMVQMSAPVVMTAPPSHHFAPAMAPAPAASGGPEAQNGQITVDAPMVGTFYRAPSPDASPFVEDGHTIAEGQTICIIEAMKLMNEIKSEISGKVVRVLAENGQPVEYGQPLFLVEPAKG